MKKYLCLFALLFIILFPLTARGWHDETHLAIAKVAGYQKWYNACGADMAKLKAGAVEAHNHYVGNKKKTQIKPGMVFRQIAKYNQIDEKGHLYGAIVASIRDYLNVRETGKYGEYHLAFCAHYVGDLSMPLHNTLYNDFNQKNHSTIDGTINHEVLDHLERIEVYRIALKSEKDLAKEIVRIADLSMKLGYQIEQQDRLLTKEEAYKQISHSASLFRAILKYVGQPIHKPER
jgi:hypothetical protein